MLDWSDPVTVIGPAPGPTDWLHQLLPHWPILVEFVAGEDSDAMSRDHWHAICGRFNQGAEPTTPEEANERFREVVVGMWKTRDALEIRQALAARARRARSRTS